jgi:hypothetical protein
MTEYWLPNFCTRNSQIDNVISTERTEMLSLLSGATAAIIVLIIFLVKWNSSLDSVVKRRTKELNESNEQLRLLNKQLAEANEQLKIKVGVMVVMVALYL